jgi:glycosyltransferase involved in cell wall biosynthesis
MTPVGDNLSTPKVSVIIAAYNWSSVIGYAIKSVLWQTFQSFEVLVIGDACTDDTGEVVASFNDPRVIWYNLPENIGNQYGPNNKGIEMARGEYIAYLGQDDVWYPTHLQSMVATLDSSQADIAFAMLELIWPPKSGKYRLKGFAEDTSGVFTPPSGVMHRRDILSATGVWKDFRITDIVVDQEFIRRVTNYRKKFVYSNQLTVFKFPAAKRPNSYIECPSYEQAEYVQHIQTDPDFIAAELLRIAKSYGAIVNVAEGNDRTKDKPGGWLINQIRVAKGLDPLPLNDATRVTNNLFLVRVKRKIKHGLRQGIKQIDSLLDRLIPYYD